MIHNEPELIGTLRKVVAVFDTVKIDYALCGSFAGSVYGEACATRDVDIIAAVAGRHAGCWLPRWDQSFMRTSHKSALPS